MEPEQSARGPSACAAKHGGGGETRARDHQRRNWMAVCKCERAPNSRARCTRSREPPSAAAIQLLVCMRALRSARSLPLICMDGAIEARHTGGREEKLCSEPQKNNRNDGRVFPLQLLNSVPFPVHVQLSMLSMDHAFQEVAFEPSVPGSTTASAVCCTIHTAHQGVQVRKFATTSAHGPLSHAPGLLYT